MRDRDARVCKAFVDVDMLTLADVIAPPLVAGCRHLLHHVPPTTTKMHMGHPVTLEHKPEMG